MSQINLSKPQPLYVPSSETLGHIPELPKLKSRFIETDSMDMDMDDVNRVAIYLNLGLQHRGSIDATSRLNDIDPITSDPITYPITDFASSCPPPNRSSAVSSSKRPLAKTKFFTVRDRGSKKRAKARRTSIHSLKSIASQKTDPLERWNSRKGRKWTSIRARARYDDLKKRVVEKKKEQRIATISKAMGKIISGVMGIGGNNTVSNDTEIEIEIDYSALDIPLPTLTSTRSSRRHRSIEDWLQQQQHEQSPITVTTTSTPTSTPTPTPTPQDDNNDDNNIDNINVNVNVNVNTNINNIEPLSHPSSSSLNFRSLGHSSMRGSMRGIFGLLRDPPPQQVQQQPVESKVVQLEPPSTTFHRVPSHASSSGTVRSFVNATTTAPAPAPAPAPEPEPEPPAPAPKRKFASLRGIPSAFYRQWQRPRQEPASSLPNVRQPFQSVPQNSNSNSNSNARLPVNTTTKNPTHHSPYSAQKSPPSRVMVRQDQNLPSSSTSLPSGISTYQNQYVRPKMLSPTPSEYSLGPTPNASRSTNPYLKRKAGRLYRSSAEASAAIVTFT